MSSLEILQSMRLFLLLQPLICVAQWHKRAAVDLAVSLDICGGGHVLMGTGWEVSKCLLEVLEVAARGVRGALLRGQGAGHGADSSFAHLCLETPVFCDRGEGHAVHTGLQISC